MAITQLRGMLEGLEPMLASLGASLARLANPGAERERHFQEMISQNPALIPVFAEMVRNAEPSPAALGNANTSVDTGAGTVAQVLGLRDPALLERIVKAAPPGVAQQIEAALRADPNYVQSVVAAKRQEPLVSQAAGTAQIAEAGAVVPEAEVRRRLAQERIRLQTPELQVLAESGKLNLERGMTEQQTTALKDYDAWLAQQPPELRSRAAMNLANPALAGSLQQELQFSENMRLQWAQYSLQEKQLQLQAMAARQKQTMDPLEQYRLFSALSKDISDEINLLRTAEENDDEESTKVRTARLNEMFNLQRTYFPGQISHIAAEDQSMLFNNGVEFESVRPLSPEESRNQAWSNVIGQLNGGRVTMENLTTSQFWKGLSGEERSQFMSRLQGARGVREAGRGAVGTATEAMATSPEFRARVIVRNAPTAVTGGGRGGRPATTIRDLGSSHIDALRETFKGRPVEQVRQFLRSEGLNDEQIARIISGR